MADTVAARMPAEVCLLMSESVVRSVQNYRRHLRSVLKVRFFRPGSCFEFVRQDVTKTVTCSVILAYERRLLAALEVVLIFPHSFHCGIVAGASGMELSG